MVIPSASFMNGRFVAAPLTPLKLCINNSPVLHGYCHTGFFPLHPSGAAGTQLPLCKLVDSSLHTQQFSCNTAAATTTTPPPTPPTPPPPPSFLSRHHHNITGPHGGAAPCSFPVATAEATVSYSNTSSLRLTCSQLLLRFACWSELAEA